MSSRFEWSQAVVLLGAAIAAAAWIGIWVEWVLATRFDERFFGWGRPALTLEARVGTSTNTETIADALAALPSVAVRKTARKAVLVRERAGLLGVRLQLPPLWSPRMRLTVACQGLSCLVKLEVRNAVCWRVFLLAPVLTACLGLAAQRSATLGLFAFVIAALVATVFHAISRGILQDAHTVWMQALAAGEAECDR